MVNTSPPKHANPSPPTSARTSSNNDAANTHRDECVERVHRGEVELGPDTYVFSDRIEGSTPVRPDAVTGFFRRVSNDLALPEVHLHSLRHFMATQLASRRRIRPDAGRPARPRGRERQSQGLQRLLPAGRRGSRRARGTATQPQLTSAARGPRRSVRVRPRSRTCRSLIELSAMQASGVTYANGGSTSNRIPSSTQLSRSRGASVVTRIPPPPSFATANASAVKWLTRLRSRSAPMIGTTNRGPGTTISGGRSSRAANSPSQSAGGRLAAIRGREPVEVES